METRESLKQLERRAYRSTFVDGIYDIQFGLLFLVFAWISILEFIGLSRFIGYSLLIIPILLPWLGKRFITIPRMGAVEFGPKRKSRKRLVLAIGAVIVILTLPLLIMIGGDGIPGRMGWLLVATFAIPVFVLAVYSTEFPRLYVYAALLIFGVIESEFLLGYVGTPLSAIISFGIPGAIILVIGLTLLFRFLHMYPRPTPEAHNAG